MLPEFQRWGLGVVILARLVPIALEWGIEEAEFSWVLESNHLSFKSLKRGGAKLTKTYRVYDYPARAVMSSRPAADPRGLWHALTPGMAAPRRRAARGTTRRGSCRGDIGGISSQPTRSLRCCPVVVCSQLTYLSSAFD